MNDASPQVPCPACREPGSLRLDRPAAESRCTACGAELAPSHAVDLDEGSLATYLTRSEVPVALLVTGDGCALCPEMRERMDELARHLSGACLFARTSCEAAPGAAEAFGVTLVPQVILFRDGAIVDRAQGLVETHVLGHWLTARLLGADGRGDGVPTDEPPDGGSGSV